MFPIIPVFPRGVTQLMAWPRKCRMSLLDGDVTSLSCLRWRFGPDQGEVAGTEFHTLTLCYLFFFICIRLLKAVYVNSRVCLKIHPLFSHRFTLFSVSSAMLMADASQLWWWCDVCYTASEWSSVTFIFLCSSLPYMWIHNDIAKHY